MQRHRHAGKEHNRQRKDWQLAHAENFVEHSAEFRMQLDFVVRDAALRKFLPAGWEPNVATQGAAKDCNLRMIFIDRIDVTDASGAARFSRRPAVTSSSAPSSNRASVMPKIQITNKAIASAKAARDAPLRWCHHIATEAATNAPAP